MRDPVLRPIAPLTSILLAPTNVRLLVPVIAEVLLKVSVPAAPPMLVLASSVIAPE